MAKPLGSGIDLNLETVSINQLMDALGTADDTEISALLEGCTPTVFARLVKRSSDRDIRALMESGLRSPVLDRIMNGMVDAFRPDRARGVHAVIHWKVLDRPDGG